MRENEALKKLVQAYMADQRIAGATMIVRRKGEVVCDAHYGYADMANEIPLDNHTILRLASMTKPIVAISVMILAERGLLSIDDPLSKYLPEFAQMKVADRLVGFMDVYEPDPDNPSMPRMKPDALEGIGLVDAARQITLRDMLSHSSGMGQGPFSMGQYEARQKAGETLAERVRLIAELPLDLQPGEHTGYSAAVAYDVVGCVVELVSGASLNDFIQESICKPLGCRDLSFVLNEEQRGRIARLYESNAGGLLDVSDADLSWQRVDPLPHGYYSGSAGLLGSVESYDRVVQMLARGGTLDGVRILRPETVVLMSREASAKHLEMAPGTTWGIGMMVTEAPEKSGRAVGKGTFGWSGAYGTHFYIDSANDMTVTLGVSRSNIGGAGSPFSKEVEDVVMREYIMAR